MHTKPQLQIARYGGEEFILYLEATTLEEATDTLQCLRHEVRSTPFKIAPEQHIPITISIGLAQLKKHMPVKDAISIADKYLYIAKEKGRDQLISSLNIEVITFEDRDINGANTSTHS